MNSKSFPYYIHISSHTVHVYIITIQDCILTDTNRPDTNETLLPYMINDHMIDMIL